jgi:hypothetical protein
MNVWRNENMKSITQPSDGVNAWCCYDGGDENIKRAFIMYNYVYETYSEKEEMDGGCRGCIIIVYE